ncbi:4-(cytidine 5'-diphospho)-2-C-methyl-D-erythritol kinase [Inediibacterium massiliense]|uniref:4-(cytidine 5'-diphospho)-2-C-methyl-D-erythritol kinase n=1 Tax=Inediibacterium massiliense TaxID=1658111 RepID=UPI0006B5FD6A|nr:4-(cytidine 5'-diphospho)-2-C-methyl-D-erythritol kinase [Inediibacterium massiliense]
MEKLEIKGRAKINLSLDVLKRREDGYHEVKMIMQQIDLYDEISLKIIKNGIILNSNCEYIPNHEGNIAYKAAQLMIHHFGIKQGIEIYIHKNIPVAAGLAGGSTDAAAVMIGMNELFNLKATKKELMDLGVNLGADVPFCILGGAALAEGIGEKLTSIQGFQEWIVLCKPNISVSTASVYGNLNVEQIIDHPKTEVMIEALKNKDIKILSENLCNVLEPVTESMHPIIKDIKKKMLEYQALGSIMSGSGPTVFGIYKDYNKAKSAYENLSKIYNQVYIVKTYNE